MKTFVFAAPVRLEDALTMNLSCDDGAIEVTVSRGNAVTVDSYGP